MGFFCFLLALPLFNMGSFTHPIHTTSAKAQKYFDQGLVFYYGFDNERAKASFEEGARLDPDCAMCYWGVALADPTSTALKTAEEKAHDPEEKAYIEALKAKTGGAHNYATALHQLTQNYPRDPDALVLYAGALADLNDWNFYHDDKALPHTEELTEALEKALKLDPKNPGANHFYIHAIEYSGHPEKGLPSADFLRNAVPGSEHLVHMPSHIYLLTGRYHESTLANERAIVVSKQDPNYEKSYLYRHNLYYLWRSLMMEGRERQALSTARELARVTPHDKNFSHLLTLPYSTLARFSQWSDILVEPEPQNPLPLQANMWHYARAQAFLHTGKLTQARQERAKITDLDGITPIAQAVLDAELAPIYSAALPYWQKALELQNHLDESSSWYFPVQEGLAWAALKDHHLQEAEKEFKEVLKEYPENGWSLFGLSKTLHAQEKDTKDVDRRFKEAWKYADRGMIPGG